MSTCIPYQYNSFYKTNEFSNLSYSIDIRYPFFYILFYKIFIYPQYCPKREKL